MRVTIAALFAATAIYAGAVGILATLQRRLIYVPDTQRPNPVPGTRVVTVRTGDGLDLQAWLAPPADATQPVILFLHGNGGNIGYRAPALMRLTQLGWGLLLLDYRGYGGNPGEPSEAGLVEDTRAAYATLRAIGVPARHIVPWGESLGSGLAVRLASEAEVGAVLLEAPYTSIAAVGKLMFPWVPVNWVLRDRFDLSGRLGAVRAPVLVLSGGRDEVIPPAMHRAVFDEAAEPKAFWLAPEAGHNDLTEAGAIEAAIAFVRQHWRP